MKSFEFRYHLPLYNVTTIETKNLFIQWRHWESRSVAALYGKIRMLMGSFGKIISIDRRNEVGASQNL